MVILLHRMIAREYCESLSITVTGGFGPLRLSDLKMVQGLVSGAFQLMPTV